MAAACRRREQHVCLGSRCQRSCGLAWKDIASHHFQRCRVLVALQMLWMVPVLYFSDDILIGIGQDAEVAARAGEYIRASLWGLFAFFQYEATRKYLQNREDRVRLGFALQGRTCWGPEVAGASSWGCWVVGLSGGGGKERPTHTTQTRQDLPGTGLTRLRF